MIDASDPQKTPRKRKKSAPRSYPVKGNYTREIYDLICLKAAEARMQPATYVSAVVADKVSGKPDHLMLRGITSVGQNQSKLSRKMEFFLELFIYYLTHYFADHPELPADKQANIAVNAEKRRDEWLNIFGKEVFEKAGSHYQAIIADLMEDER